MSIRNSRFTALTAGTAIGAMALMLSSPANAIVPNDNFTPDDIVDTEGGVNGVGMFFRNDGFVCSGSLINPRTVLFAAHCVNDRPESDYGTIINSAWSFDVNALPGFQSWIAAFQSNPDLFVYNVNQIMYDPRSIQRPEGFGFLEADIALASLDTPAANIPSWTLLFSPLPDPGTIDATDGTGYHVNITGYGRSGSGTTGASQGIDWRRRAAENMLGSLASLDDRNLFLFGTTFGDPTDPNAPLNPQVLYSLDFDDPNKTNPFDFNLFKDEPREREATTAGGDSGGPLILDAENNDLTDENLVIGVLSGGSRFFGPQVFSSYGTQSFYQPLFLYWDYIVANNPYRYVQTAGGDGDWEDPNHWVTVLDPAYRIIDADGNVVAGLPTSPGDGLDGDQPKFGEVCFDPEGPGPVAFPDGCQDFATGDPTPPVRETLGDNPGVAGNTITDGRGVASLEGMLGQQGGEAPADEGGSEQAAAETEAPAAAATANATAPQARTRFAANEAQGGGLMVENAPHANGGLMIENAPHGVDLAEEAPHDGDGAELAEEQPQDSDGGPPEFEDADLPDPTLENGLPGATGFVPDNIDPIVDPDPAVARDGRYFDVTLNNSGVTTLSSAVTIDRLQVGGNAGLTINPAGDLTSLIDITQTGGAVRVNGSLTSVGDYSLLGGLLTGTGTVNAPFVTSVMGGIAPGTMGTTGTLTINGNLILSSGSSLMIDLGNGAPVPRDGDSDRLVVTGEANLGGTIGFARAAGTRPSIGDQYLLITADGGLSDSFDTVTPLSAILYPILTRSPNAIRAWISARTYGNTVDRSDRVARSYADLLDDNRFNPALQSLFDYTDFLPTGEAITDVLASFAPTTEATVQALAASTLTELSAFHNTRLALADRSTNGGTIAMIGSPVQTAALANSSNAAGTSVQSDVMTAAAATAMQAGSRTVGGGINEDLAVYVAGGFINGESNAMRTVRDYRDDDFTGYFLAGGVEYYAGENAVVGASVYYQDLDADAALANEAESDVIAGTIYGRAEFGRFGVDGQFSLGHYSTDTRRTVRFANVTQTLTSDDGSTLWAAEGGIDYEFPGFIGSAVLRPGVDLRYSRINFDALTESGGSLALTINRRDYESLQGRAGAEVLTKQDEPFQALFSAHYVYEFLDPANTFQANFAAGTAPFTAPFALGGDDRHWAELGIGLRYNAGNVSFDLSAHTTVERNTVDSQAITAGVNFRF